MTDFDHLPEDLANVARRLEAERPTPSGVELERMRHRAMAGEVASKRSQENGKVSTPMKPRIAIVSMLAAGTILMGAGTGLAVSGISGSDDAGKAQYPTTSTTTTTTTPQSGVAGANDGGGVAGAIRESAPSAAQDAQQLEASSDSGGSLPFTGFAAIPLIAIGIGLLGGGLALRRRKA